MKIVIDKDIPFLRGLLEPVAEVVYLVGGKIARKDLDGADALLVRTRTRCDASLLDGTPVRFIGSATIGYDHIDDLYCRRHGITWSAAPGCNAASVQQYIAAALVHCAGRHSFRLPETVIGVVGVGNVGGRVAELCRLLGMQVLCNDPPRERAEGITDFVSLETLYRESDIITFHVPLTRSGPDATYHLLNDTHYDLIGRKKIIMNTSRGNVVDEGTLKKILKSGSPGRAVIDVWSGEPAADRDLIALAGIATPHIAGYSVEGKANGTAAIVRALSRHFHLGLDDWYPAVLPRAENADCTIDCGSKNREVIIGESIKKTYDIMADDTRFRTDPASFEHQRSAYPVRREFSGYSITLQGPIGDSAGETAGILKRLGFNVSY